MITSWQETAMTLANFNPPSGKKLSWREISEVVGKPRSTVSDFLRKNLKVKKTEDNQIELDFEDNSRILFISDLHAPYQHPRAIKFLEMLKEKYSPTRVICLGDECDKHSLSYHDHDPDLDSASKELEKAKVVIHQLHELFPKMDIVDSNHGSLAYRKAKSNGIPRAYIKSYNDVLGVGDGWKWHFDMTLTLPNGQQVYVHHGKTADALKVAQAMGMNFIQGHHHERLAVQYYSTPANLLWGVNAGCLIDRKSLAFAYSNNNLKRPVIGTAIVIDGHPVLESMPL